MPKCVICGKLPYQNPEISIHRFPKDPERKKQWLLVFGLEDKNIKVKEPFICSDHFHPNDFMNVNMRDSNQRRVLRPGVIPQLNVSPFAHSSSSTSSPASVYFNSPPKGVASLRNNIDFTDLIDTQPEHIDMEQEINENIAFANPLNMDINVAGPSGTKGYKDSPSSTSTSFSHSGNDVAKNPTKSRKRKRGYIGDIGTSDFSTPEKAHKNLSIVKSCVKAQKKVIKSLHQTVRRQRKKITTLNSLLSHLRKNALISENSEDTIKATVTGPALDIFERMLKGHRTQKYNPHLRSFALTLAFYSPRAYNYVRKTFNRSLPHLATLTKWYKSIDGSPGFTQEALNALTLKQKDSAYPLLCNLVMDEMSIRKQVEWTGKKFVGYVDIGTNIEGDVVPEAKEVLAFMAVCLNGPWKVPVGYFLLDGLSASERSELVNKCLQFIHESGVTVLSLTFDGAPVNFATAEKLGANFSNINRLKTYFEHPVTKTNVYIMPDACHMIKLIRNCFGSQQHPNSLTDATGKPIDWKFIEKLVEKQNFEGLHAATKVRMRHLQWQREKMKVRFATQTLSKSVADAITFLREDQKSEDFKNSEGTSDFILLFNNIFDIFNSRSRFTKYTFKKPLSPDTANTFFDYFEHAIRYIDGVKLKERSVLKSQRKTGFLGFIIAMNSLKQIYEEYVCNKKYLKYILTYKFSQDHLELFFGAIRSKGGFNNNPTARQFEAAYKRLLVHSEIKGPNSGNATNLEDILILTCGSGITKTEDGEDLQNDQTFIKYTDEIKNDLLTYTNSTAWHLTDFVEDIVAYISGYVAKSLDKCLTCLKCKFLLQDNTLSHSQLQERKTFGKLYKASSFLIRVCREGEKIFRFFCKTQNILNKNIKNLDHILIKNTFEVLPSAIFNIFDQHMFDEEITSNHGIQLVKLILKSFFKIRIHHEMMKHLDLTKQNRSRSINTKTILFRNE